MHADDFRHDRYGVVSGLRDGGYSDDMTLAALAGNLLSCKSFSRLIRNSIFLLILKLQLCILIDLQPFNCSYIGSSQEPTRGLLHLLQLLFFLILLQVILVSQGLWFLPIKLFYYIYINVDFDFISRYWNYLRKQTFVLESYISKVNWLMNRALFSSHCYLSWGFVAPYLMAMVHVAAALQIYIQGYSYEETTWDRKSVV